MKDGSCYVGTYINDVKHGRGTIFLPTGEEVTGFFV